MMSLFFSLLTSEVLKPLSVYIQLIFQVKLAIENLLIQALKLPLIHYRFTQTQKAKGALKLRYSFSIIR